MFFAVAFLLYGNLSIHADNEGLITHQITIKLEKAGTLPDSIDTNMKYKITNLKIIGDINGTDVRLIRDMAGATYISDGKTQGKLSILDLSQANIVNGGTYYWCNFDGFGASYSYTQNNVLGGHFFYGCSSLKSVNIPNGVTKINSSTFWGCSSLTSINIPNGVTKIDSSAFYGCRSLTSINIPDGITKIEYSTFLDCI